MNPAIALVGDYRDAVSRVRFLRATTAVPVVAVVRE
jgi:hypothetical protein